jgi:DNA-binding transcriptional LysR family regulator
MSMKLDLKAVEALDGVVRYGGFGRAAKRLHRVQSSISHQIGNMERQLGVRLLDRDGHRVRLTPAGEGVLAEGRRLLVQAERVRSVARQFLEGWEPQLLIVIDGIVPLDPALAAVRTLTTEGVPTRIQVSVEFLRGVQTRFENDRGDLMLAADYMPNTYLQDEALPEMDCVLCVGQSHPLAKASTVSLSELQDHVELSVQRSSEEQEGDRHLFGCERRVYLPSFQTKREALVMGVGFGWMPFHLVWEDLRSARLRELPYVGGARYRFTPRLVHRLDRPLGRAGVRFVELMRSSAWPHVILPQKRHRKRR